MNQISFAEADDAKIIQTILESEDLPSLPVIASQLLTLIAEEETSLADIADLVSMDIGLSSKILKVVNSAFYNLPHPVGSVSQAVSLLGPNAIQNLVLSCSFFNMKGKRESQFDFEKFWENSFARGVAAKFIHQQLSSKSGSDNIFVCGLLQNLGKLIFACTLSEHYEKVLEILEDEEDNNEDSVVERNTMGIDHSLVSARVAEHWGFPKELITPLRYHHTPLAYQDDGDVSMVVRTCYLSDLLVKIYQSGTPEQYHRQFRADAKQLLGLNVLDVNTILKNVHKQIDQTAKCFGLNREMTRSVEEILQEANLRLCSLNLTYEEMNKKLIESQVELERMTRELQAKNKALESLAFVDGLTNVNNHRFFQDFLDQEISRARRNEGLITLLMMDIDNFKSFNDDYGHQAGDFILKEFCRVAQKQIREYDLLARYGGEEFVCVLPESDLENGLKVAERIRHGIATYIFEGMGKEYSITVSIGVASAQPSREDFAKNDFISYADDALYKAKKQGRNRVIGNNAGMPKRWYDL